MKNSTNLLDGSKNFLAYLWDKFSKKGTTGMYQVEGTVDGVDYVVGLNKGRVGQFYKNRW